MGVGKGATRSTREGLVCAGKEDVARVLGSEAGPWSSLLSELELGPAYLGISQSTNKDEVGNPVGSQSLIFTLPVPLPLRIPHA